MQNDGRASFAATWLLAAPTVSTLRAAGAASSQPTHVSGVTPRYIVIMDEYVKPVVETLKPYDLSASKLIKGFGLAGTIGALLIGFVLVLAIKLRLLSKLGYYLGSVGNILLPQFLDH